MTSDERSGRPRLGLVLGSGGLKGAACIGLIRALEREGIKADMVVGCSAGAVYSAALALNWDSQRMEKESYNLWQGLFAKHDYGAIARALLQGVFPFDESFAIIEDDRVNEVMVSLYGEHTFADTSLPLHLVATDLHTAEKVVISEGLIREAVRASISLPLILRPTRIGNRLLIDGATSDPLPVDVAIREDCQIILAMGFLGELSPRITSLMGLIDQSTSVVIRNLLKSEFAFYNSVHDNEIFPVMVNFDRPVGLSDTALLPYVIEQGIKAVEKQMPHLLRALEAL